PMAIVGGLDIHRRQVTFDYVDTETGRVRGGVLAPADRGRLRAWLDTRFAGRGDVAFAVEAGTGWRYVAEARAAGGGRGYGPGPAGAGRRGAPARCGPLSGRRGAAHGRPPRGRAGAIGAADPPDRPADARTTAAARSALWGRAGDRARADLLAGRRRPRVLL